MAQAQTQSQAHAHSGQQHPIRLYLVVWGLLFVLSTFSYLVDYLGIHSCDGTWCSVEVPGHRLKGFVRQAALWGVYPNEKIM